MGLSTALLRFLGNGQGGGAPKQLLAGESPKALALRRDDPFEPKPADLILFKGPAGAARESFTTKDFPEVKVISQEPLGRAMDAYLNKGDLAPLIEIARNVALPGNQRITVEGRDLSSSMSEFASAVLAGEKETSATIKSVTPKTNSLYVIGFNGKIDPLTSAGPVDVTRRVGYTDSDLHLHRDHAEGKLAAGSQIADTFHVAAGLAFAHKVAGFPGEAHVSIITDGWNRHPVLIRRQSYDAKNPDQPLHADWEEFSEARAKSSIAMARAGGVTFSLVGFVNPDDGSLSRLQRFAEKIGLTADEIKISKVDREDPGHSICETMRSHGASMTGVFKPRLGN